jgi:hypothetical protein
MPNHSIKYHILNGDALKTQFPNSIPGNIIVCREMLMDGPVASLSLTEFFKKRHEYLEKHYGALTQIDYEKEVVGEFNKITTIPPESDIHFWFEDDLFCQVNFWFVGHLISKYTTNCQLYLIRPPQHTIKGFGGLDETALEIIYKNKTPINSIDKIAALWSAYSQNNNRELLVLKENISSSLPFMVPAINAQLDRAPKNDQPGRPIQTLISIINELEGDNFGNIFREFCKRESIYGYGDLQVRRMVEEIVKDRKWGKNQIN